jgi:serine/threonine protein kinase
MKCRFPVEGNTLRIGTISVKINSKIAASANGFVYKVSDPRGQTYALKAIGITAKNVLEQAISEHRLQAQVSGDINIVAACACSVDQDAHITYILMELCQTSLANEMKAVAAHGFTIQQIVDVFQRVCAAVHSMHSQTPPVSHRNLTPDNILLSATGWKLSDFGSATTVCYPGSGDPARLEWARAEFEGCTPLAYRAPETIDIRPNRPIDHKVDVWGLGCLLYKLCTFVDAFADARQILTLGYAWPDEREVHQRFKELVSVILNPDPELRPTAAQVLGQLYAAFPSVTDPAWKAFAPPPKPPPVVPRARLAARGRPRRAPDADAADAPPGPRVAGRRHKRHAIDLAEGVPIGELEMAGVADLSDDPSGLFAQLEEQFGGQGAGSRQAGKVRRSDGKS